MSLRQGHALLPVSSICSSVMSMEDADDPRPSVAGHATGHAHPLDEALTDRRRAPPRLTPAAGESPRSTDCMRQRR